MGLSSQYALIVITLPYVSYYRQEDSCKFSAIGQSFVAVKAVFMSAGMKKSITIRDVALRAGVSIAAVSRALNESGYVSSEIKQRVHEAVKELHYRPHDSARGLKLQRTNTIGLVIADISNP